ncbi:MlaD family protein [Mucilaginibacter psychrotolerans]|uniref:MCE family protein n=1 Tax=Mucilaginibacter psychrotolerans TaxID=1524096 RepID=A0A4Y8SMI7_9SPHI|nr:MlaD family protein [Mucilaginibacter psychrotolerans]TFF39596.1 MCE family protein [Mucilaginibacter psychrotolerans]
MKISNETKIGALTAVSITILILCYSFLKGNDVFSGSNKFYAVYRSVEGLTVSKPVLVNGFQIGRVSKMQFSDKDGRTTVEFKINSEYDVPDNTLARLESTDLLGGKAIVFELGNHTVLAQSGDTLRADIQGSLAESLQPIQRKAEVLITKVDSAMGAINHILNPDFQKNVDRSFASIANSLETLEATTKKIDALVGAQSGHIDAIMANAEATSGNLKASTVHLDGIASNFKKFSSDLAESNIKQTMDNANKAVADLQSVLAKVNSTQGSLGLLMNDTKLYDNLNNASKNLDNLMIDLKAHPSRYVHFSVFGKKGN